MVNRLSTHIKIFSMAHIAGTVSDVLNVAIDDMLGKCRKRDILEARQLGIYFVRRAMPHLSDGDIAKAFNIDRTTIIYSVKKVEELLDAGDHQMKTKCELCYHALMTKN